MALLSEVTLYYKGKFAYITGFHRLGVQVNWSPAFNFLQVEIVSLKLIALTNEGKPETDNLAMHLKKSEYKGIPLRYLWMYNCENYLQLIIGSHISSTGDNSDLVFV